VSEVLVTTRNHRQHLALKDLNKSIQDFIKKILWTVRWSQGSYIFPYLETENKLVTFFFNLIYLEILKCLSLTYVVNIFMIPERAWQHYFLFSDNFRLPVFSEVCERLGAEEKCILQPVPSSTLLDYIHPLEPQWTRAVQDEAQKQGNFPKAPPHLLTASTHFEHTLIQRYLHTIRTYLANEAEGPVVKTEHTKKNSSRGWWDGSEVKSTGCSSRGTEFNSLHPQGSSQPSVMRSDALFWPAGIYAGRTLYIEVNKWMFKENHNAFELFNIRKDLFIVKMIYKNYFYLIKVWVFHLVLCFTWKTLKVT
jgi:hypothetical protein